MASAPWQQGEPIPARAGIGLRPCHYRALLAELPPVGWLEAHSENYFGDGGQPLWFLERLRAHYPLSLHGVGLGLGSADPLDGRHLARLGRLVQRMAPTLVSEHLCWNRIDGRCLNDLLPLPYTEEALDHVVDRIQQIQEQLRRPILIENLSSYLEYRHSTIPEWEFLVTVAERAGCGILLDVNNLYVNARNHGFDPLDYLYAIPPALVGEIHLAGYEARAGILIDTHSRAVTTPVWRLYALALEHLGAVATLIEWDQEIPELAVLLAEAGHAQTHLEPGDALSA